MMSKAYLTCLRDAHERLRSAMFPPRLLPLLHSDPPARLAPPSPLAPLRSDVAVKFGSNSGFLGGEIREKMDSMTQSAQISSSQGFADGQNSAAKESKLSDSFLSTSPVSLIQSPQDKKVVVGTDKPSESVTTSLRFPSQPGSFSASNYGSEAVEGQPDSPIKTSPVSERIKALEALAAKKREPEYRDFRDRHHEKSSSDVPKLPPSVTKPTIDIPKPSANIPKPSVDKSKPPTDIPKLSFDTPRPTMDISKPPSDLPKLPADGPVCSTQKVGPGVCKMEGYPAEESPESPFEVLGELRQGSEYEETEEWMKAHLPPVLDIDAAESNKSTSSVLLKDPNDYPEAPAAFASVPDAFMDSPVKSPKLGNELIESQKQPESEEEFDISFLPVAYMCGQQEKANVQDSSNVESVTLPSDAAPAGLDSPSPSVPPSDSHSDAEQKAVDEKDTSWGEDLDRPVLSEADSSGESEDTVIEEGVGAPDSALQQSVNPPDLNDPPTASDLCSSEKVVPPPKSERKLMQVPTINVIETDEPNYSDEEMENEPQLTDDDDLEIIDDSNNPRASEPEPQSQDVGPPKTRPLETEFIEGYSPPSSPVDSDAEYSPKHNLPESISEGDPQQSVFKSEVQAEALEKALAGERAQTEKSESMSNTVQNAVMHDDVDFPDNNDEWSDEGQDSDLKLREESLSSQGSAFLNQFKVDEQSGTLGPEPCKERADVSMTSFMQDDIYDRQSFDYENDEPSPLDYSDGKELDKVKKQVLLDPAQEVEEEMPDLESDASFNDDEVLNNPADHASLDEYPQNPYSCFHNQTLSSAIEKNTGGNDKLPSLQQGSEIQPDLSSHANVQDQERISGKLDSESSFSEPPNSFVEFMRECLKSRQDEEPDEGLHSISSENELSKAVLPSSQSPPGVVMDLDQERITAGALNELGSNHDETPLNLQTKLTDRSEVDGGATSAQPSPFPSVRPSACSQSRSEFDNSYSKEVEAVDEWMAEAYYLAEHILTTILTHLSVKDLIHWRDPKKSGVVFGLSLLMLLSLAAFSVISVASYLLLALLIVTISFRIYKSVLQAVQKSNDGHPFKMLIDKDVSIPPETFRKHVDASLTYINRGLKQMSRLFLVEDLVDSLKLAVVMWLLTYVGAVFNGITLLILADILLFAVPPVYEKNKTQIDQYIDVVRTQVNATVAKLQEKLPGAVKRSKTE